MRKLFFVVLVVGLFVLMGCGRATPSAQTEEGQGDLPVISFSLPMGYIADPQYAPFYVAKERGYFREAGFEVAFDYSFETNGVEMVGLGEVPFAIVSGDVVLLARSEGLPVKYVMEWWQGYPIGVASRAEAGIEVPGDLAGREVGIPGQFGASYVGYAGLLAANGLAQGDVRLNEVGFNQVEALVTGQVEAVVVYVNNEPLQLAALGEDVRVLAVSDYVDLVASGLITNEAFAAENPERVRGFVGAFVRGLADTLADPDGAYEIAMGYVEGLDGSRRGVLGASLPLWAGERLGESELASWENTEAVLLETGFLGEGVDDLTAVFTNEFLPSEE